VRLGHNFFIFHCWSEIQRSHRFLHSLYLSLLGLLRSWVFPVEVIHTC
jgi:hypothetical protein